jgi:hypothetical protein
MLGQVMSGYVCLGQVSEVYVRFGWVRPCYIKVIIGCHVWSGKVLLSA